MIYSSVVRGLSTVFAAAYENSAFHSPIYIVIWYDPITFVRVGTYQMSSKWELYCTIIALMKFRNQRCELGGLEILCRELLEEFGESN